MPLFFHADATRSVPTAYVRSLRVPHSRAGHSLFPTNVDESQEDVGGWPELAENRRELTLPDEPNSDDADDGYTNLEEWLHGFAMEVKGR
jgi:hypothetical protein